MDNSTPSPECSAYIEKMGRITDKLYRLPVLGEFIRGKVSGIKTLDGRPFTVIDTRKQGGKIEAVLFPAKIEGANIGNELEINLASEKLQQAMGKMKDGLLRMPSDGMVSGASVSFGRD